MDSGFNIFLIEDNPADIVLTREALAGKLNNYDLDVAEDGAAAWRKLEEARRGERRCPDLILLDLNLPKINGLEILQRVKQDEALKCIPVVILTTSSSDQDVLASYRWHANSFIQKPVSLESFHRVVAAIEEFWIFVARLPRSGDHVRGEV